MHLFIYLNSEGTEFEIKKGDETALTLVEMNNIHPVFSGLSKAKGTKEVAAQLINLQQLVKKDMSKPTATFFHGAQTIDQYDDYTMHDLSNNQIRLSVIHRAARYKGHVNQLGVMHRESIEEMIKFVDGTERVPLETPCCALM